MNHTEKDLNACAYKDQVLLRQQYRQIAKIQDAKQKEKKLAQFQDRLLAAKQSLQLKTEQTLHIAYPEQLPVSQQSAKIVEAIKTNQVVIVAGETGSGKTTQLPKICLEAGLGRKGLIGHTQPRRLAARTVSNRIAEEMQVELGSVVGYQVRFTDQVSDKTLVKVMTDGILLAEIKNDKYLYKYDALIIDEAHERSLNIDFLLGYLKRLLVKRPELKLIITSATIDVERFSDFFNKAPVFSVSGRSFPVDVFYRPAFEQDEYTQSLSEQIACTINEIIDEEKQRKWPIGDVLVFLPGEREIREISRQLEKDASENAWRDTEVLPLYARLTNKDQNRVFAAHRGRRIVLATNVAETSITVPGIRYVIDPGTVRMSRYSYRSKIQRLPVEAVSQASANQRMGRCGRVAEGICYRLYSEEDFLTRSEFTDPEILRTNLAAVILKMLDSGLGKVSEFEFIDEPDSRLWNDGYKLLQELGALDQHNKLTPLGRQISAIPSDPRLGKMLMTAVEQNCVAEVLVIVSALSIQDPRERPQEKQQAADQAHSQFKDIDSDFVSFLHLWHEFEAQRDALSSNQLKKYCQKNYLSFMRMREWREIHRQLYLVLKEQKLVKHNEDSTSFWHEAIEPATKDKDKNQTDEPKFKVKSYDAIHRSLLSGLLGNIGVHDEKREYLGCRNRRFTLFPGSGLSKKRPKWIFAAELVETQQVYARYNAKIEPLWIEGLAKHLIKKNWSEPHYEAKRAQVIAKEKVTLYGLEIVSNRPVNYSQIDPKTSREIFIRSGLVEEQYKGKVEPVKKNRALISKLESIEDRTRKRDIVVDDEVVFQLYDDLLPPHVVSGASFEKWFKNLTDSEKSKLYFSEQDLTRAQSSEFDPQLYPDHLENNGIRFPLSYAFNPGNNKDGVSISVPVNAIKQLDIDSLEKLVPGLLREKCTQLIKTLPRTLRKHFVPVPDVVEKILPRIESSDLPLLEALAHELKRLTLVQVPIEAWNPSALDDHLKFNIQVLNEKGKVIEQGRDPVALADKVKHLINESAAITKPSKEKEIKATSWEFGKIEDQVTVKQLGIELHHFPALKDEKTCVQKVVCNDKLLSTKLHKLGVARLLFFKLQPQFSAFKKQIKSYSNMALLFAPVGKAETLYDDFLMAAISNHFFNDDEVPTDNQSFMHCYERKRGGFFDYVLEFSALVESILTQYHELMKLLKGKMNLALAMPLGDLQFQLQHLIYPGFLCSTPQERLKCFPRYLQAALVRHEKMPRDLANERRFVPLLAQWWKNYEERLKKFEAQGIFDQDLEDFRWLMEEQRVSWYAQQLGTQETVSEKRLNKLWDSIRR